MLAAVCASALAATGVTAAAAADRLRVNLSVPSVMVSNGVRVWVANTGSSSVLEINAANGVEAQNVKGKKFHFDISDGIALAGDDVWVANAASDTVTEFHASTGALVRVLSGGKDQFQVPGPLLVTDHRVFVTDQKGDRITVLNEATGARIKVLGASSYHFGRTLHMVAVGGDIWTVNGAGSGSLSEFSSSTYRLLRVVTASAGHLSGPSALASDGTHLWVSNSSGNHVSELNASNGALVRTISSPKHSVNAIDSIVVVGHVLWLGSTTHEGEVLGLNATSGAVVKSYLHRFGYPTMYADKDHAWVLDRAQSRLTELNATTGAVIRVVSN